MTIAGTFLNCVLVYFILMFFSFNGYRITNKIQIVTRLLSVSQTNKETYLWHVLNQAFYGHNIVRHWKPYVLKYTTFCSCVNRVTAFENKFHVFPTFQSFVNKDDNFRPFVLRTIIFSNGGSPSSVCKAVSWFYLPSYGL